MADVGGIINRLAPLIETTVRIEYNLLINSKTEATKLYFNLKEVQKVLEEAERRRLADPRVKAWLENLQDVMYEIDDALDEWETLDLQLEILRSDEENASRTWLEKVGAFIECLCFSPTHVFKRRGIALKIKALNEKVDSLGKETGRYALLPIISDSQEVKYEITAAFDSLIEIPYQQDEKKKLVNQLLPEGREPDDIQVISLVGMAGVGKTTLAQLVFNDPRVQSGFALKSWICVSHISDIVCLTKAILQSLRVSYHNDAELQTLFELIQSSISGKKFFLVLDNVRIEDERIWNQLKVSIWCGGPGSRILVTSRNNYAMNLIGPAQSVNLRPLGEEDCLSLLRGIALRGRTANEKDKLGGIVEQIAKKCEGLPLAAKTLGYYMQSRITKQLWDDVLEKEVWKLDEVAKALFAPFAVTYNELPLALKHCFLYSAIVPKNTSIYVDELTRLWMVQGYIETELQGWDYFEKLARNFFFKDIVLDSLGENIQHCRMHPILHDFARYLTKTESKIEENRSFYSDQLAELGSLKSVRVLIMRSRQLQEVPLEIGVLIHLRYLDLRGTAIKQLPETICNLCNLKSLFLQSCKQLSELPEKIHRLRNLMHLLMDKSGLNRLPQGLKELTNLVALDQISVGREANKFGYLEKLNQLRDRVCINIGKLNEKEDDEDAEKAKLGSKIYISDLRLKFRGEEVRMEVMEALQAPPNLRRFLIHGYNGVKFPNWISTSLNKTIQLDISNCNGCKELPPLGKLPLLECLRVSDMKSLERVGREFLGDPSDNVIFPNLWKLEFLGCDLCEEWEDITEEEENAFTIMPRLKLLSLKRCSKLKALPDLLLHKATSLRSLLIDESCPQLSKCYSYASPKWEFIFQNRQSSVGTSK